MSGPRKPADETVVDDEQKTLATDDVQSDGTDTDDGDDLEVGEEPLDDDDDSGEEDLAGDDEGQEDGQDQVDARRKPPVARLREERRLYRERAEKAEREVAEIRARQPMQQQQDPQSFQRQLMERRNAELAAAKEQGPDAFVTVALRHQNEDFNFRLSQIQNTTSDANDRVEFRELCRDIPAFKSVAQDVERELANLRSQGGTAQRVFIAKYLLGDKASKNAERIRGKDRKKAEEIGRREKSRTSRNGNRSDVGQDRRGGDERQQRANRLKDVLI